MQKFIITEEGVMKFGDVRLHKDLLHIWENECYGGGFWRISDGGDSIMLYGSSFDFGPADFDKLQRIDWSGIGGKPTSLLYYPNYPDLDWAQPIYAKR